MSVIRDVAETADLLSLIEKDVPVLAGTFNGRMTPEVPCPKCGGKTRFRVRLGRNGKIMAFCSHCAPRGLDAIEYLCWRDGISRKEALEWWRSGSIPPRTWAAPVAPPVEPLDPAIAEGYHRALTREHRRFLKEYWGLSDAMIDRHRIGWAESRPGEDGQIIPLRRFSIPCWDNGILWAIQFRAHPLASVDASKRYVSWPGPGRNRRLFNTDILKDRLPYLLVLEGPRDALFIGDPGGSGYGWPAIAPFMGNNSSNGWDTAWNNRLNTDTIYVIPDNKKPERDVVLAMHKVNRIPGATMIVLPDGIGDVGDFWKVYGKRAASEIEKWLRRPPVIKGK